MKGNEDELKEHDPLQLDKESDVKQENIEEQVYIKEELEYTELETKHELVDGSTGVYKTEEEEDII